MNKMTVRDVEVAQKRVLVRVDFNVPRDPDTGEIVDDSRIKAALPTVRYLVEHGAKTILCSHLGRPKGKVVNELRLEFVAQHLSQLLGQLVETTADCIGPAVKETSERLKSGDILLLDNLRFHAEEEQNADSFASALSQLADIYVNDAFAASHRAHASIVGIAHYLPAVAGFMLENEVNTLSGILENPKRPFAAILGGAKISDKIGMMENIMDKADYVLIGGGMAATFLKANHCETGHSLIDLDKLETVSRLMKKANGNGTVLSLPQDVVVSYNRSALSRPKIKCISKISRNSMIVDIGLATIVEFYRILRKCQTIFWNGTMGIHEMPQFSGGTKNIAQFLANLNAVTVVGGGSTAEAANGMGLADKMSFVSTGGGATLEFLGAETLPGLDVLLSNSRTVVLADNRVYAQARGIDQYIPG